MGILIAESVLRDANRSHAPMPGATILRERLTADPFDRKGSAKGLYKSTNTQVFNGSFTTWGTDARPATEAMSASSRRRVSQGSSRLRSFGHRCQDRQAHRASCSHFACKTSRNFQETSTGCAGH